MPSPVSTLYGDLVRAAADHCRSTALDSGQRTLAYGEFLDECRSIGAGLFRAGLAPGDRVCLAPMDKASFLLAMFACIGVGAVPVPLSGSDEDMLQVLSASAPAAVLTAGRVPALLGRLATQGLRLLALEDTRRDPTGLSFVEEGEPDQVCTVFFTSGTTSGVKKGILITHGNLASTSDNMNALLGVTPGSREYVCSPVNFSFGFGRCRALLKAGARVVLDEGPFNPAKVIVAVKNDRADALSTAVSGMNLLLGRFAQHFASVGSKIQRIKLGSMPLAEDSKARLLELCPRARIFMNYGLTEAQRISIIEFGPNRTRLESVGRSCPGVQVAIDDENGGFAPAGQAGEILVRGPNVANGYLGNPQGWTDRKRQDWLRTGDLGVLDGEGYLTIVGRADDVINMGGLKFHPGEVEPLLERLVPAGSFCLCQIEDPDGIFGQIPVLCVEGECAPALAEVHAVLGDVADFKRPRRVFSLKTLPRTDTGKIKRKAVRALLETPQTAPSGQ